MARQPQSNFDRLATKLAQRRGVNNPRALAARIGRDKLGQGEMTRRAGAGRRKRRRRKHQPANRQGLRAAELRRDPKDLYLRRGM